MTIGPLAGFTVGITATRRREELGTALARRGARVMYGPAIRIVALADDAELLEATKRCLAAPLDYVVATTGVGFRGWLDVADSWGLKESIVAALDESAILTRGPKVRGAVRAVDLREAWSPESESTSEVLEHMLSDYDLAGKRVAVQLHGEPLRELVDTLREAGADVIEVPVYRWEPPEDEQPLLRLIEAVAGSTVDAVAFTSAPAALNFLRAADEIGADVRTALRAAVLCAAVGPVAAGPLLDEDIPVVQPVRFRLGALVREIVDALPARATQLSAGGYRFEVRGRAVLVDGNDLVSLPSAGMALLRALAEHPGQVCSGEELAPLVPGASNDGHAVEAAIGRLRTALGDPGIVQTVMKRGYRLATDD